MTTQQPTQKPPEGLLCPRCGCNDLRVWQTRKRAASVQRIRVCQHCGRRVITSEKVG